MRNKMSFNEIAQEIIRSSINSAICVDNAFIEPYGKKQEDTEDDITPKGLYESFKKEKCNLTVYKHIDMAKWKNDKEYVLKNRDLLILDWQLNGDPGFKYSLEILWEAIHCPGLPFVIIYTQEPDISEIVLNIRSYFGHSYKEVAIREKSYEELCDEIESAVEIENADEAFRKFAFRNKDYVLKWNYQDLEKIFLESFHKDQITKIMQIGHKKLNISTLKEFLEFLVFTTENCLVHDHEKPLRIIPLKDVENTYIIKNTLLTIYQKEKPGTPESKSLISPEFVLKTFSENICKWPNNIFTLLYLEMKNIYRENYNNIGNEIIDIDEKAFFLYRKNLKSEEDFYDFIINCWKNEITSFNLFQKPKLFSVLDEYEKGKNYDQEIKEMIEKNPETLYKELIKLNYHYSFIRSGKKNRSIRFGDLFQIDENGEGGSLQGYVLCITPHCDCLYPENIKSRFLFVYGEKDPDLNKSLISAEKEFYSFLIHAAKPLSIKWDNKPFTFFIPENTNNISTKIEVQFQGNSRFLNYIGTQKENYTQRIANESFSQASRVGIDLAKLKLKIG
jgi:hypothetical protein